VKVENLELPERIKKDYIESGITELNPPQRKAVDAGLMEGQDMIVASPTASGKTFIAELAMVNQVKKEGGKAVYIVPLKALASEKYEDFSERYEDLDVMMSVGDRDESGDYLETADIVIVTSEKLDSMLRHNPSWIHEINLVVTDEIHLLTSPNRGPTLEVTLTRLRDLLDFQMLGLSATISNSSELADWLNAKLVESDYRPVELKEGIMEGNEIEFFPEDYQIESSNETNNESSGFKTGKEIVEDEEKQEEVETEEVFIDDKHGRPTSNLVENTLEIDKQAIIFCSSRKGAEKSSDRCAKVTEPDLSRNEKQELKEYAEKIKNVLGNPTSQCKRLAENVAKGSAFHHAGLVNEQRKLVEEAFKKGLIRTVSATPTLAAGVNLPAYRVIMRDLKRYTGQGMDWIPVLEYEQMCLPYSQKIILPDGRREQIGKIVEEEKNIEVLSYNEQLEPKDVTDYFSRKSEIIQIETETGSFHLTKNHPVMVKQEGSEEWVNAGDLEKGDKLKLADGEVSSREPFFYNLIPGDSYVEEAGEILVEYKEEFNLKDEDLAERLDISSSTVYHYKNNRKATPFKGILKACEELGKSRKEIAEILDNAKSSYGNRIELPEKLTEDFLWLAGIIVTDGNLNRTEDKRTESNYTKIRVFNTEEEIIDKVKTIFKDLGLECYEEEREPGKYRVEVGNTLLAEIMNKVFKIPYGNKSQETQIPELIFSLPNNLKSSFVEGIFDGDGSYYENKEEYKRRIHFSTSSAEFAEDLRELLAALGVKSRKNSKFVDKVSIDGEEYEVNKESYFLKIRDKNSINKLAKLMEPVKSNILTQEYSTYNNSNNHRREAEEFTEVLNITEKGEEKVYNIEVKDNHNYLTGSRAVLHNCGRAGRPKYDDQGEAIAMAKNPGMKEEILERYILGEAEHIQSKLAVEPVLRMHTLSLVASSFCTDFDQLMDFYEKTFYAYQFGDMEEVKEKIRDVVQDLIDYGFLNEDVSATKVGKRVSELYIDPDSANLIIESLEKASERETRPISYLFMLSRTTEMKPRPRVKDKEWSEIQNALSDAEEYLMETVPNEWEPEYEPFLECMKNSMLMQGWISEVDEEQLMDKYGVAPGGIRAKMQNADWLIYASKELARMKDPKNSESSSEKENHRFSEVEKDLEKLRIRLQHGIKEELLSLVQYNQIGRVRARKLHDHGIRDQESIRETDFEKMKKLIGKSTARKLKKQVGQENIFDRENIMDYFE
jgi:replicative superfamily II helicase/transcriptional regulator with XRE-family HTH domain